eukprot:scaffold2507_cov122-Isochrysis_galbana.AAC.1
MEELYKRKLWHQLTVALEELVGKEEAASQLVGVYDTFISDFKHKLNELALARIQIAVALRYTDEAAAIAFGETVADEQSDDMEAGAFVLCELARMLLRFGEVDKCKDKLDLAAAKIEGAAGVTAEVQVRRGRCYATVGCPSLAAGVSGSRPAACPCAATPCAPPTRAREHPPPYPIVRIRLQAAFYRARSAYFKIKGPASEFYRAALLLLAYAPLGEMATAEALEMCFDLGIAALVGEGLYNFGELLEHPVVSTLEATQFAWLAHLLRAFSAGDIDQCADARTRRLQPSAAAPPETLPARLDDRNRCRSPPSESQPHCPCGPRGLFGRSCALPPHTSRAHPR